MKSPNKYLFLCGVLSIFLLLPSGASAQTDSIRVEYGEEQAEKSDYTFKEAYNYLIRAQVEEKTLFKIGVNGFGYGSNFGGLVYTNIGVEQKLWAPISVYAEYKRAFRFLASDQYRSWPINDFNIRGGFRYYYNINRRIRQGKSANNFSINYFSLQQTVEYFRNANRNIPSLAIVYGLQRRIGKWGYVDSHVGPAYYIKHPPFGLYLEYNLSFGIGL